MKHRHLSLILIFLLAPISYHPSYAQTPDYKDHSDFEKYSVYYTLLDSTFISPEIASLHGIKRSKYEMLLNISLSKKGEYGALPADIRGTVTNLMQQQKTLKIIEISEGDSTYYLSPVRISGKEIVRFHLFVTARGETSAMEIKFSKEIFEGL